VGVFNGDGGNVRNPDSQFDFIARGYLAPLALLKRTAGSRWLSEIWFGGSVWYGRRIDVPYDLFPPLSSNGGATFIPPVFGSGSRLVPDGSLFRWALEANIPVGPVGWRFELVRVQNESLGIYQPAMSDASNMVPLSRSLAGHINRNATSFYVQMWYWILGSPSMLPTPGQEIPARWSGYRRGKESFPLGLYVAARYERLTLRHDEVIEEGRALSEDQRAAVGSMSVDSFGVAANLWLSRHIRFSANYFVNYLDGDMPLVTGSVRFPPAGPLMQPTSPFFQRAEHELLFRAAFAM
jgi:hypothetical protein